MKTLHVHIGTPKTATTAIQRFCKKNETVLESKGYCYPVFPFLYGEVSDLRNGHFLIGDVKDGNGKVCEEETGRRVCACMQMIRELFRSYDHVILSDEAIWRNMDVKRKNLWTDLRQEAEKEGFRIHVIVYLRRQDKFLMSLYRQTVKRGKEMHLEEATFEEYMQRMQRVDFHLRFDYDEKLERIARTIGKEHITVRRFEREHFEGGSIYSDFLYAVGLPFTEEYAEPRSSVNLSLNGNMHEFKRVLNGLEQAGDRESNTFIIDRLRECSEISGKAYPCELFSKEEAENFLKQYEAGNRKIAEEYLHEPGGELFDGEIADIPKWQKENPYVADDLLRFIGATGIYLYREHSDLRREVCDLERDLKDLKSKARHPFGTMFGRIKRKLFPQS